MTLNAESNVLPIDSQPLESKNHGSDAALTKSLPNKTRKPEAADMLDDHHFSPKKGTRRMVLEFEK